MKLEGIRDVEGGRGVEAVEVRVPLDPLLRRKKEGVPVVVWRVDLYQILPLPGRAVALVIEQQPKQSFFETSLVPPSSSRCVMLSTSY
jgi:hypothetical protein